MTEPPKSTKERLTEAGLRVVNAISELAQTPVYFGWSGPGDHGRVPRLGRILCDSGLRQKAKVGLYEYHRSQII